MKQHDLETKQKVILALRNGETSVSISKRLSVSRNTISLWKRNGILRSGTKIPGQTRKVTLGMELDIYLSIFQNPTISNSQLEMKYDCPRSTISKYAKNARDHMRCV